MNGVSFWALGYGSEINASNGQGCTQFVADKITRNDVRFSRCALGVTVPEPSAGGLLLLGTSGLLALPLLRALRSRTA